MAIFQDFWRKYIWEREERAGGNIHDPNTPINGYTLSQLFGGTETNAGKNVNMDNAMNFSAVWACTRILSGVISSLPFKIYQILPQGRRTASDHPYYRLTKYPNSYTTKSVFFQRAIIHYLNWGYHLAKIKLGLSDNAGIELIHPRRLKKIEISTRNKLIFTIDDENGKSEKYNQNQIIYVPNLGDDLIGKGIITHAREDIGIEFAAQEYGGRFFKGGGKPTGLLTTDEKLSKEQGEAFQKGIEDQVRKSGNLLLSHGFKYQPMSIPPEDAQFLGTRSFSVLTIARWYGVPPEKLAELDRATYGNIEQNAIAFLADTVAPILSKFEQEYTLKILDADNFYFEFDMDGYMRADIRTQAEVDRIYATGGIRQINEIRQKKNWNPVEYGDNNFMQMNMTTLENIVKGNQFKEKQNGVDAQQE